MREKKHQNQLLSFLVLSLVSVLSVLVMASGSYAAMDCSSCHGDGINPATGQLRAGTDMRPVDAAYRNISTGGVVGSHQSHMKTPIAPSPANGVTNCAACHNNGTYATGHRSGTINLNAAVSYNTGSGTLTFKNVTTVPVLGTCSTASCHANPAGAGFVQTPTWGTNTASGCTGCHQGGNVLNAYGPNTGTHASHNNPTCTDCHNAGTSATTAPTAGHNDGDIDVLAGLGYTANKAKGTAGATCSAASCHVSPTGTAFVTTPAWGTNTASGCAGCHTGSNTINSYGSNNGSHTSHNDPTCTDCHNAGTTATTAGTGHRDGDIDVLAGLGYPANKVKGSAGATCSSASCHVSPVSTAFVTTPAWGTNTASGCAGCHMGADLINTYGPNTGTHASHNNATCTVCHNAGTSATTAPTTGHRDGNIDVLAGLGYTPNKTKGTAGVSCSSASCHVDPRGTAFVTTPAWGTNTASGCAGCHTGANVINTYGPNTGTHASHNNATCTVCHNAGTTATTGPTTGHMDGDIDVLAGLGYTANKVKGSAGASCSAASCHVDPRGTAFVTTPTWGTNTADGCAGCHTGTNLINTYGPNTGTHLSHNNATCTVCHNAGTTASTAPTTGHRDGDIDVLAGLGYTANKVKGSAGASCSAASCHVSPISTAFVTTPTWGTNTADGCLGCHSGANVINSTGPATYGHVLHMSRTAGVTCTSCHAAGTTATTAPTTGHRDGDIDVTVGSYTANKVKGSAPSTCSNVACHNSPAGHTPAFTAPAATWGSNLTCGGCHAYPPAGANHTPADANNCNSCHNNVKAGVVVSSTNTIFVNNALHMNGIVEGGACDSCHGYPPVRSMSGRGTNASYSSARIQNYSGGGGVHDIAAHVDPTTKVSKGLGFSACATCHPNNLHNQAAASFGGMSTQFVQVVVDPKFKFDKNRPIVYTAKQSGTGKTTGTCNNVECHMQKSPVWSSEAYTQRH